MGADPGDRAGEPGDGVVGVDHRAVPGAAAGGQLHPGHALLGGLDQVEPAAADGGAEAADLADGLGAALELVAVLLDEHLGAVVAAGLLVGGEAQHDRPLGHPARRAARARTTESSIASKSFMSTAPRPHT